VEKVLVSACLLGAKVRYHGGDARSSHDVLQRWRDEGRVVSACPEVDGGLSTPRPPAEIVGLRVMTREHTDVTGAFARGADEALRTARAHGIRVAVLKDGSPSCGNAVVYDGTFSGSRRPGRGVTTTLLLQHGIRVFSEEELDDADAYVRALEHSTT
jgi:uncharacterized protein YbbK (DUF523 family)